MKRSILALAFALAAGIAAGGASRGLAAQNAGQGAAAAKAPDVKGEWVGTWGPYGTPAGKQASDGARLDAKVEMLSSGKYQATFWGECGRPYKYTIQVPGRTVGSVVLFQGSADLGEKDGGVYDWIGRATDREFVGFYTSQGHVGQFKLTRAPAATAK